MIWVGSGEAEAEDAQTRKRRAEPQGFIIEVARLRDHPLGKSYLDLRTRIFDS